MTRKIYSKRKAIRNWARPECKKPEKVKDNENNKSNGKNGHFLYLTLPS